MWQARHSDADLYGSTEYRGRTFSMCAPLSKSLCKWQLAQYLIITLFESPGFVSGPKAASISGVLHAASPAKRTAANANFHFPKPSARCQNDGCEMFPKMAVPPCNNL
jgi:hypothetical protein